MEAAIDPPGGHVTLVIGGARSGKSRYAQMLAERSSGPLIFIATAQAFDAEMTDRIARHRADRDDRWQTIEAPIDLVGAISQQDSPCAMALVDCLTLWTSNLLLGDHDVDAHLVKLDSALAAITGQVVLVTNEIGWGIVPHNALARRFRDIAGRVNQTIAARARTVDLVVAGLPIPLKRP